MENNEETLLERVRRIEKIWQGKGKGHITFRAIREELSCGSGKANAMTHGKDCKLMSYSEFFSFLFDCRNMKMETSLALEIVEEAIKNKEEIAIVRLDKRTHQMVGELEIIMKQEG